MFCSKLKDRIRIALCAAVLGFATAVGAAETSVYVQVRPLRVSTPERGRTWDMTPVLKMDSLRSAQRLCSRMAHVVEVFVRDVASTPVTVRADGLPDASALALRLMRRSEEFSKPLRPAAVYIVRGFPREQAVKDGLVPFPIPVKCADLVR